MAVADPELALIPKFSMLIGGDLKRSGSGAACDHVYAATGRKTVSLSLAGAEDVDAAVAAARAAFPKWRAMPVNQRRNLLLAAADIIEKHADELARTARAFPSRRSRRPWSSSRRRPARHGAACWVSVMTFPPPPNDPYSPAGILNFVFGEMWDRPGLGRKARRFVTMASVEINDAIVPIASHIYASLKSGDVSMAEMEEFILQFAIYAGWPKASAMQGSARDVASRIAEGRPLFG